MDTGHLDTGYCCSICSNRGARPRSDFKLSDDVAGWVVFVCGRCARNLAPAQDDEPTRPDSAVTFEGSGAGGVGEIF